MDLGQNIKNPQDRFVDITKIKVHSHFCDEPTTWWPGKFLRTSKIGRFCSKMLIFDQIWLFLALKTQKKTQNIKNIKKIIKKQRKNINIKT